MIKIVQASVDLEDRENRVVTIVKGKYGLRNKSDAITFIIKTIMKKRFFIPHAEIRRKLFKDNNHNVKHETSIR